MLEVVGLDDVVRSIVVTGLPFLVGC
jgi:hypothetical protein